MFILKCPWPLSSALVKSIWHLPSRPSLKMDWFLFIYVWLSVCHLLKTGYVSFECVSGCYWPLDMKNCITHWTLVLPLPAQERRPNWKEAVTIVSWCTEKEHVDRQRDKTGECSTFPVANRIYSHSRWGVVSTLWQTNCHVFVPPSRCNCTPASFTRARFILVASLTDAAPGTSLTLPWLASYPITVTVAGRCGELPHFPHKHTHTHTCALVLRLMLND